MNAELAQPISYGQDSQSCSAAAVAIGRTSLPSSQRAFFKPLQDRLAGVPHPDTSAHQLLTMLLAHCYPVEEADHLAQALLTRFGSMGAVLAAPASQLRAVATNAEGCIGLLKGMHQAMALALREPVLNRPILKRWSDLEAYLRISLGHEAEEVVRLLFLDARNALLLDEEHARGTVNHTPVYPRKIVARVLETRATALIIVHNHPSGDPMPTQEDIDMTRLLARVLDGIGVSLHDHIVVGRHRCESLRQLGLFS